LLEIVTTICIGVLVGVEFALVVFINPIVWKLESFSQAVAIRVLAARMGKLMPFWYLLSFGLLIAEGVRRHGTPGYGLALAAIVIWLVSLLLTLFMLAPVNIRLALVNADTFADGVKLEHLKWDQFYRVHLLVVLGALICFLVAVLR
jgi:uncharacterized membrane protein